VAVVGVPFDGGVTHRTGADMVRARCANRQP
jgi:arginase family enzyme